MCFRAIIPQNNKLKNCWKKIKYFPWGGGVGYPSMENSMKMIYLFFEPIPNDNSMMLILARYSHNQIYKSDCLRNVAAYSACLT